MVNVPNPIKTAQTASRSFSVIGRSFRPFTDECKCFSIRSSPPTSPQHAGPIGAAFRAKRISDAI